MPKILWKNWRWGGIAIATAGMVPGGMVAQRVVADDGRGASSMG